MTQGISQAKITWKENTIFNITGLQYQSLISSIPKEWRKKLQHLTNVEDIIISPECKIIIQNKETCVKELTTKYIH